MSETNQELDPAAGGHTPRPVPAATAVAARVVQGPTLMPRRQGRAGKRFHTGTIATWQHHSGLESATDAQTLLAGFPSPRDAVQAIVSTTEGEFPTRLAFGLGFGPTGDEEGRATARLNAEAALRESVRRDAWTTVRGAGAPWDEAWSAGFRLVGHVRARWTRRQLQVIRMMRRGLSQKDVAGQLRVSTGTVCTILKTAHWSTVQQWERATLNQLDGLPNLILPVNQTATGMIPPVMRTLAPLLGVDHP